MLIFVHFSDKFSESPIRPMDTCPGFQCTSGSARCIPKWKLCNKIVDCLEAEDELSCELVMEESDGFLLSPNFKNSLSRQFEKASLNQTLKLEDTNQTSISHKLDVSAKLNLDDIIKDKNLNEESENFTNSSRNISTSTSLEPIMITDIDINKNQISDGNFQNKIFSTQKSKYNHISKSTDDINNNSSILEYDEVYNEQYK